ncbi:MAG: putative sulfate exporter family transporter [Nitrospirae bacterium]|nr:MAG: putative sulfate exporter family transporter [Nitrospirota bacterium]
MAEQSSGSGEKCVIEKPSGWSNLVKGEDWLAVWLGFLIIILILAGVKPKMPTFKWETAGEFATTVEKSKPKVEKFIADAQAKGEAVSAESATALKTALDSGDRAAIGSAAKKLGEDAKAAKDEGVKKKGEDLGKKISGSAGALAEKVFSGENIGKIVIIGIGFLVISSIGIILMGGNVGKYIIGFPIVYILANISQFIAGNSTVNYYGLEYVIFALIIGLLISNVIGVPKWLMEAVRTEYFIKTGLVILGAGILFKEILQGGALGIVQAICVVTVVWYSCYWLSKKLKLDDDFAALLSSAVSICGVSAAIATCGAIEGDKKKLSYVTSLVLIVAVPMMIIMPWIVKAFGIPELVGGAWLGGTLDTSGSVVAAGALISEPAMKTGVIVKFSQNVLIGVAAFILSIWWTVKKGAAGGQKVSAIVIWERFPKFVLGFIVASIVFSFLLDPGIVKDTKGLLGGMRTVWFALAFTSIGLETRFKELVGMEGGRPAAAFIIAQTFNVIWTLILAYLLFGGFLFTVPDIK